MMSVRIQIQLIAIFILLVCAAHPLHAQSNKFQAGEKLSYGVYYHLWGVWVAAGDVTFSVEEELFKEKECFKFTGAGKTHSRYDWFYKVRDTYESFADKNGLIPYRFKRDVSEGGFYFVEDCIFDPPRQQVLSVLKVKERELKIDTSDLEPQSFDVLSMIYHARNLDFASYQVGDKIPIKMFIDRETHPLFIRFLGTETYDHSEFGEIECYVFSPLLVDGTIFKSGEKMKVYVTMDSNVIPIYVESEIRVGSIRAELSAHNGLLAPFGQ